MGGGSGVAEVVAQARASEVEDDGTSVLTETAAEAVGVAAAAAEVDVVA